jgi:hypothetical protein
MYTINNAGDLLKAMRKCQFVIKLNGDFLEVQKSRWIDDVLSDLKRTHKASLIKILESEVTP